MIDERLIKKCQSGDAKSQRLLYKEIAPTVLGICRRYCPLNSDAEDLFQDVFIRIFTKIDDYQFAGSFEGWVRRITVSQAVNRLRGYKVPLQSIDDERASELPSSFEKELQLTSEEDLLQMVSELPDVTREIFNLFAIEGWSHDKIAEHLNISSTASRSHFFRSKKILKEKIEKKFGKEEVKLYVK